MLCGDIKTRLIQNETLRQNIMHEKKELKRLLLEMIDGILSNKEEDERKRQHESRDATGITRGG